MTHNEWLVDRLLFYTMREVEERRKGHGRMAVQYRHMARDIGKAIMRNVRDGLWP